MARPRPGQQGSDGGPADLLCRDGIALINAGRYAEAIASFDVALAMRPGDVTALNNRGVALNSLGRHEDALENYRKTLAIDPNDPFALYNSARSLDELRRFDEALQLYARLLKIDPRHAVAHNNMGTDLDELGRSEEALAAFARALALQPEYPEALNNRGTALAELGRPLEALTSYDAALALDPDYVDAHWNRSLVDLRQGNLARGWAGYEWRRKRDTWEPRTFAGPQWDGMPAAGRRILLYAEQGLGDTLQFLRFARNVAVTGAPVVVEVQAALARLASSIGGGIDVIGKGQAPPAFDCHLPLMSVPFVLKLTEVPAHDPYLAAEPERVARWSERIGRQGLRVGIAWQGNPKAPGPSRAVPLRAFAPLARLPGVRLISLQKNFGSEQLADLPAGMAVETFGDDFDAGGDAFLDTAAVMSALDLVVTSDTAVAHLAGALGRPVWIALRHVPDWRWMPRGETTPWYPSARLFIQAQRGAGWDAVFARMAQAMVPLAHAAAAC